MMLKVKGVESMTREKQPTAPKSVRESSGWATARLIARRSDQRGRVGEIRPILYAMRLCYAPSATRVLRREGMIRDDPRSIRIKGVVGFLSRA
jgi:hypothetical protein